MLDLCICFRLALGVHLAQWDMSMMFTTGDIYSISLSQTRLLEYFNESSGKPGNFQILSRLESTISFFSYSQRFMYLCASGSARTFFQRFTYLCASGSARTFSAAVAINEFL